MIKKIDHVALVVKDTEKAVSLLSSLFEFETVESRANPEGGFKSTLIAKADVMLELIEPTAPEGPIRNFVEKRGGGLHHISIQVSDLDAEMERLRARGAQFVSDEPVQVTDDTRVVFIHPHSTEGLMIELMKRK